MFVTLKWISVQRWRFFFCFFVAACLLLAAEALQCVEAAPWRAAAPHRSQTLQVSFSYFRPRNWTNLADPVTWNICGGLAACFRDLFTPPLTPALLRREDEVNNAPPSGATGIRWSPAFYLVHHRPNRCSTSSLCGKRHISCRGNHLLSFPCLGFFFPRCGRAAR